MPALAWGEVELEPEVRDWLLSLGENDFQRVRAQIDLLEQAGAELGEPHTRQLRGKLRELRFYLRGERERITYYIASGRRIILLTVFYKTQQREPAEIDRAERVMLQCIAQGHTPDEEPD